MSSIPAVDSANFRWRQSPDDDFHYSRQAGGMEYFADIATLASAGTGCISLGLTLTLAPPYASLTSQELLAHVRRAWIALRWDVPTLGGTLHHTPPPPERQIPLPDTFLDYYAARSPANVAAWAEETVLLQDGYADLAAIRADLCQGALPRREKGPHAYLHVLRTAPTSFGLLLFITHEWIDGLGTKALATLLLQHLALSLSSPAHVEHCEKLAWGSGVEARNLLPPMWDVLAGAEVLEGPAYERTYDEVIGNFSANIVRGQRFSPATLLPNTDTYNPAAATATADPPQGARREYTFAADDAERLLAACRTASDGKLTLTHVGTSSLAFCTRVSLLTLFFLVPHSASGSRDAPPNGQPAPECRRQR
jgi:hypothetical protein